MKVINKMLKVIRNPRLLGVRFMEKTAKCWSDEKFLKWMFYFRVSRILNLKHPTAYNDKLQWLKLNYRRRIMTDLVDKYKVKEYVKELIGDEYIIPTLGIYDSVNAI